MKFNEEYKYEVLETAENPADAKIKKTGLTAEFTMNDIDRDLKYLQKKKDELDGLIKIEAAKMVNIDNSDPKYGQMSEPDRQIVFIYQRAFSVVKEAKEKVEEINAQIEDYKHELMDIALQTGLLTNAGTNGEESATA